MSLTHVVNQPRKRAKRRMGAGWSMLSTDMQEALIAYEAAMIILDQCLDEYGPAQEYLRAVCADFESRGGGAS